MPTRHQAVKVAGLSFLFFLGATLPVLAQDAPGGGFAPQQFLVSSLEQIRELGAIGVVAFIGLYILAAVAFLPGSILTLGAGFIYGIVEGVIYVFIGATIGATAAFLVGRYIARGWVSKKIEGNRKFAAIDKAVGTEGLKIVLLTRLSPVFPFNLLNYAYGLTSVSLKDYVLGSVGMIPGTLMYVYFGSLAENLATIGAGEAPSNPILTWVIRIVGFAATAGVVVYVTKTARKILDESVTEEEISENSVSDEAAT